MSSLTTADIQYLEKILDMASGYVLNFTNATFGQLFNRFNVNIHGVQYRTHGSSKAKKLRVSWEKEPDPLVSRILSEMLDTYEAICHSTGRDIDAASLAKCREAVARLSGAPPRSSAMTEEGFLEREFNFPNIHKLPVESAVSDIIQERLDEAQKCLSSGSFLSTIIQCGSVLEAVLLGAAQSEPERFNRSSSSPKRDGKVKPSHAWSLAELINVAHEIGLLKLDVQKFSHGLRDFRNYIHPYQQLVSRFRPDEHTAKVCVQVLKAALADVAGERA